MIPSPGSDHKYGCLGMDSLARLICRCWDQAAYELWAIRYGHQFPVYAVIDGKEVKWEP